MADVNAHLPMWSGAYWSQAERDRRQEAEDDRIAQRQLMHDIILQKMVVDGQLTAQQARDIAEMEREKVREQGSIERAKMGITGAMERENAGYRSKEWTALADREAEDARRRETNDRYRDIAEMNIIAEHGPDWRSNYAARQALEQRKADVNWLNSMGQLGGDKAFGPDISTWPEEIRNKAGLKLPTNAVKGGAIPIAKINRAGTKTEGRDVPNTGPAGPMPTNQGTLSMPQPASKFEDELRLLQSLKQSGMSVQPLRK